MSNSGGTVKDDAIREIAAGAITGSYQPLGSPYLRDSFRCWITNNTNGDIYLSLDGVTDNKKLSAASGRAADDKTNDAYRKMGTQWYVRYASVPGAPAGWFALEVEYV